MEGNFSNHNFNCKLCKKDYYCSDLGITQDKENLKSFTFCKHCLKKYNNLIESIANQINEKLKKEINYSKLYRVKEFNNIYQNINHQLKINNIVTNLNDQEVKEQINYHLNEYSDKDDVYLGDEEDLVDQLEENYLKYQEVDINIILKAVSNRFRINVFIISKDKILSIENILKYNKSILLIKKEDQYLSTDIKFNDNSNFKEDLKFIKEYKYKVYQKRNEKIFEKYKDFKRLFIN